MKKLNENLKMLLQTFSALRNPKDGCPWDRVQTHESISHCVIEEAYEVVDAIERNDFDSLKEELGDLLYQIIFHAEMANEKKAFNLSDVTSTLNKKLIRRHPHIFAKKKTITSRESLMIWENIKAQEKPNQPEGSLMEEIPKKFPPFLKSKKLQKKAKKVGFDWDSVTKVLDKLDEEIAEVKKAINEKKIRDIGEEIGDIFFTLINLARHYDLESEILLQKANSKFENRFRSMEDLANKNNLNLAEMDIKELEQLWQKVK